MDYAGSPNWSPLENVARELLADMMWMGRTEQNGVVIEQYKHRDTRFYINLDSTGQAWRFSSGTYEQVSRTEALEHVLS